MPTRDTMRAIIQDRYGPPDVLSLQEIDKPSPRDNEVLIRVRGASVNPGDWIFLTGRPYAVRLVSGLVRPKNHVLGMDVAGEVEAVGKDVTGFQPGDAVFGEVMGAYAEYASVPAEKLARKPANLSFEEAAAVPVAGMTALQAFRETAKLQPRQKVLINGASGGVGTFAVQLARSFGAEVTGVCSTRNVELVRSLGAVHVVDYTREDFTRQDGRRTTQRYDVVLDLVGSAPLAACRRLLRPTGVYISSVGRMGWSLQALLASMLPGEGRVAVLTARPNAKDLAVLAELIEAGEVKPIIDRRYALSEVPEALRHQGEGHARGKRVITV